MKKRDRILKIISDKIKNDQYEEALELINLYLSDRQLFNISASDIVDIAGDIYIKIGDYTSARKLYNYILKAKQYASDLWLKVKAYDGLAKISFYLGNYMQAIKYLETANGYNADGRYRVYNLGNSARIHLMLGNFEKAESNFVKAIELCRKYKLAESIDKNYLSLAYTHGLNGNPHKGLQIMDDSIDPKKLSKDSVELRVYYEYKGHLEFLRGREVDDRGMIDEAIKTLNTGLKIAEEFAPQGSGVGQICRVLAEIYLYLGKYKKAHDYAVRSFRISSQIGERYEIGVLHWVFAQIAEHENDSHKAEINLRMSEKILTDIGAKYELQRLFKQQPVSVQA
jgi:tetratricopeptide (TPR) repeat protein